MPAITEKGSLSFGMGGDGSGVPFHRHGHVFAEVLHGHKRCDTNLVATAPTRPEIEIEVRIC
jgi:hypothetical protein